MTINEIQDNVIEEFSAFDDWMDKYALLIDLGNSLPPLDEKYKTESNLIEGCQSRVWLQADYKDGKILFQGDSDAVIVKGIVSLLISVRSYSAGNPGFRPLFYREDRPERASFAHALKRTGGYGQADASLCRSLSGKRNGMTPSINLKT